ncbi:MAG: response regulator transcription factor [Lachnospiraceae bacterium]|jgi:two-component system response regulator ArlR|nr:response regulator transcription factor [Lachnospiraceae bacterium]
MKKDIAPKPFSTANPLVRVHAMLRRKENYIPELLTFEGLTLNRFTYEISYQINRQAAGT